MRYKTRETAAVGSRSDAPDAFDLDRYNSVDGWSRLIVGASLKLLLKHVL